MVLKDLDPLEKGTYGHYLDIDLVPRKTPLQAVYGGEVRAAS